jgi:hypothetical protein
MQKISESVAEGTILPELSFFQIDHTGQGFQVLEVSQRSPSCPQCSESGKVVSAATTKLSLATSEDEAAKAQVETLTAALNLLVCPPLSPQSEFGVTTDAVLSEDEQQQSATGTNEEKDVSSTGLSCIGANAANDTASVLIGALGAGTAEADGGELAAVEADLAGALRLASAAAIALALAQDGMDACSGQVSGLDPHPCGTCWMEDRGRSRQVYLLEARSTAKLMCSLGCHSFPFALFLVQLGPPSRSYTLCWAPH